MHSFITLITLILLSANASARPLSGFGSYAGDASQLVRVDENGGLFTQYGYPRWLLDGADGAPWQTFNDAHPSMPDTGVTRYYDFTVSREWLAPDGVFRDMFSINGQFPGPLIEANWGDMIEVVVHNNITGPEEPTSLHWHGLLQRNTPWADGALGVSQCPIAPGTSFTYRFRADSYGTSWYHSHYSAQYTAGVAGPIQIYGPSQQDYDIDLGPVMLSDWYHAPYTEIVEHVLGTDYPNVPPASVSGLINGRGRFDCSLLSPDSGCIPDNDYSTFRFKSNKVHRLRLMNHGADGIQKFAIDSHTMTVIAVDLIPVKPYDTSIVTLGVGQRVDVLVHGKSDPTGSFWMRSQLPGGLFCGANTNNTQAIRAAVFYEAADESAEPASISTDNNAACVNEPLSTIEPEIPVPLASDPLQLDLMMTLAINDTGSFVWKMNGATFDADLANPLLFASDLQSFSSGGTLYNTGSAGSVRLNVTNATPFSHPFHLHGYHFQVLASGPSEMGAESATSKFPSTDANPLSPPPPAAWNGTIETPAANPARRDTHIVPALGYAVFQFDTDNAGVWPFHCHTAWHQSGGMSVNLVVKPDEIVAAPPGTREATCDAWNGWVAATGFGPIDAAG